ncbi:MAG: hypothetical protein HS118_11365 [Bacteroidia bacterium]|nr:hypothetical protein [Bacteroidia bacterium]
MPFGDTEGNISDENGNFLMSSNGIWVTNSMGDTMPNGSGLNHELLLIFSNPMGCLC